LSGEPGEERVETEKKPTPTERIRALEADNAHLREELARYDTSEPAQKPGKAKGAKGFLEAWKPLREALKGVPTEERLKVLTRLQDEIREEIAGLNTPSEAPAEPAQAVEAEAPATPAEAAPAPALTLMERKARLRSGPSGS